MTITTQRAAEAPARGDHGPRRSQGATRGVTISRPAAAAFLERTGAVPLACAILLTLLVLPLYVWEPESIPAGLAILGSAGGYFVGAQRLRRRERSGRALMGVTSLAGLLSVALASATCDRVAEQAGSSAHVMPYCLIAFGLPTVVYLLGAILPWTRRVGEYTVRA